MLQPSETIELRVRERMKPLKWPIKKADSEYLKGRQAQNKAKVGSIQAEEWMAKKLKGTGFKWTRQALWGFRIFDFWCAELGVAVETDGRTHNEEIDQYRDSYNFHRSGIIVIRVPNFCEEAADLALRRIYDCKPWRERRIALGLVGKGKKGARKFWLESGQQTFL